jgi:hypothetical protein
MIAKHYQIAYKAIMNENEIVQTIVRMPAELKKALKAAADNDVRSINRQFVHILQEWLGERGYYNPKTRKAIKKR